MAKARAKFVGSKPVSGGLGTQVFPANFSGSIPAGSTVILGVYTYVRSSHTLPVAPPTLASGFADWTPIGRFANGQAPGQLMGFDSGNWRVYLHVWVGIVSAAKATNAFTGEIDMATPTLVAWNMIALTNVAGDQAFPPAYITGDPPEGANNGDSFASNASPTYSLGSSPGPDDIQLFWLAMRKSFQNNPVSGWSTFFGAQSFGGSDFFSFGVAIAGDDANPTPQSSFPCSFAGGIAADSMGFMQSFVVPAPVAGGGWGVSLQ